MIIADRNTETSLLNIDNVMDVLDGITPRLLRHKNLSIAGGAGMAAFFSPRMPGRIDELVPGSFGDIDIYPHSEPARAEVIEAITSLQSHHLVADTPNAHTFVVTERDAYPDKFPETTERSIFSEISKAPAFVTLQVMKKIHPDSAHIIEHYDFYNCSIAYFAPDKELYYYPETLAYHQVRQLEINNPWMLNGGYNEDLVIIQLLRFRKYLDRWGYELGRMAYDKLLSVYNEHPELRTKKGHVIPVSSGGYNYTLQADTNVWEALAFMFKESCYWDPTHDKHGIIKNSFDDDIEF